MRQLEMNQENMCRGCHLLTKVTSVAQPMDLSIAFQLEMYVKKNPFKYQILENCAIFASSEEARIQATSALTISTQAISVSPRNMKSPRY